MKCRGCGKELQKDALFCENCGTAVQKPTNEVVVETIFRCPSCGKVVEKDDAFCASCGNPLQHVSSNEECMEEEITEDWKEEKPQQEELAEIEFLQEEIQQENLQQEQYEQAPQRKNIQQEQYTEEASGKNSDKLYQENSIDSSTTTSKKKTKEGNNTKILILIAAIAVILLLGILVYMVAGRSFQQNNDTIQQDASSEWGADMPEHTEDVSASVNQLREKYNAIISGISNGDYEKIAIANGVVAYYDEGVLKAIVAANGAEGIDYNRFYYYNENQLFFAYYENGDAHKFYFDGDRLMRWRYYADSSDSETAVNHDLENNSEYLQWESDVSYDANMEKENWKTALRNRNTGTQHVEYVEYPVYVEYPQYIEYGDSYVYDDSYMIPDSDSRYISKSELLGMTKDQLKIARNEIYARHGRKFENQTLQDYFNQCAWYYPTINSKDFKESMLNSYEKANRDLILQYEKENGYR